MVVLGKGETGFAERFSHGAPLNRLPSFVAVHLPRLELPDKRLIIRYPAP